ncbi:hypothetical protein SmJEL517_g01348 [Synchytrium microbalum]|uniref:Eukaryotic membrane protein family-domain-containing protein n=1 Tax=Synchytrium microbalum TaxID=1806994 RepID=A0A507CB22_9FUNG|nr:uncharacterized protein SmJEL517_g01348 [Synchytrium microbalum]TPX36661.1 hypothetical protein SmJEL517_g01348 [Synchytrium microbalum]
MNGNHRGDDIKPSTLNGEQQGVRDGEEGLYANHDINPNVLADQQVPGQSEDVEANMEVTRRESQSPVKRTPPSPRTKGQIIHGEMTPLTLPSSSVPLPQTPIMTGESPLQTPTNHEDLVGMEQHKPIDVEQSSLASTSISTPLAAKTERGRTHSLPMQKPKSFNGRARSGSNHKPSRSSRIGGGLTKYQPDEGLSGIASAPISPSLPRKLLDSSNPLSSATVEFAPWQHQFNSDSPEISPETSSKQLHTHQRTSSVVLTWNGLHADEKPTSSSSSTRQSVASDNSSNGIPGSPPNPFASDSSSVGQDIKLERFETVKPRFDSLLWQYIGQELASNDFDALTLVDLKRERVQNFLSVPQELEKYVDASRLYHSVRGQGVLKLYVIFNVLEIGDKLCSAFGHDILDSLFSNTSHSSSRAHNHDPRPGLAPVTHLIVSFLYVFAHSMCLFYQVMTLNVAINSYNNALLTLLVSNQFVEIKGSVFKKFEKENLFQLSCSDIIERFHLSVFLAVITVRNYLEAGSHEAIQTFYELSAPLFAPSQWLSFLEVPSIAGIGSFLTFLMSLPIYQTLETLLTPIVVVFGSEVLVDWLKHAFITKFNHIRPDVYSRFRESLYRDLVMVRGWNLEEEPDEQQNGNGDSNSRFDFNSTALPGDIFPDRQRRRRATSNLLRDFTSGRMSLVDQSPAVARRIGFVSLPLACLCIRVILQSLGMLGFLSTTSRVALLMLLAVTFMTLVAIKVLLGIELTRFAHDGLERAMKAKNSPTMPKTPL